MLKKIFIATQNPKKLQELTQILGNSVELLSFLDIPVKDVEETELTLEGNAILKARSYFEQVKIPCIADDTGLEVEILNGEPGVFSARYAGYPSNSQKNIEKLIFKLQEKKAFAIEQRKAQFRTIIAFFDGKNIYTFEGVIKGFISLEPKGNYGLGYDPIFVPEGYSQTFAEMEPHQKNKISHRGLALQKLKNFLTLHS